MSATRILNDCKARKEHALKLIANAKKLMVTSDELVGGARQIAILKQGKREELS